MEKLEPVFIDKVIREMKSGKDIKQIVDDHFKCATPKLRKELIAGLRQIVAGTYKPSAKIVSINQ